MIEKGSIHHHGQWWQGTAPGSFHRASLRSRGSISSPSSAGNSILIVSRRSKARFLGGLAAAGSTAVGDGGLILEEIWDLVAFLIIIIVTHGGKRIASLPLDLATAGRNEEFGFGVSMVVNASSSPVATSFERRRRSFRAKIGLAHIKGNIKVTFGGTATTILPWHEFGKLWLPWLIWLLGSQGKHGLLLLLLFQWCRLPRLGSRVLCTVALLFLSWRQWT
mmetsp:Transcript_19313/g.45641  ORF Transcript_19313/g.45641 Transcript_19313/m.45641 type:complete len:221 (+) Transcript_19313:156-818(+)